MASADAGRNRSRRGVQSRGDRGLDAPPVRGPASWWSTTSFGMEGCALIDMVGAARRRLDLPGHDVPLPGGRRSRGRGTWCRDRSPGPARRGAPPCRSARSLPCRTRSTRTSSRSANRRSVQATISSGLDVSSISAVAGVLRRPLPPFLQVPQNEKARRTLPAGFTLMRVNVEPSGRPVGWETPHTTTGHGPREGRRAARPGGYGRTHNHTGRLACARTGVVNTRRWRHGAGAASPDVLRR